MEQKELGMKEKMSIDLVDASGSNDRKKTLAFDRLAMLIIASIMVFQGTDSFALGCATFCALRFIGLPKDLAARRENGKC